jgi:hypothetical protein
MRYFRMIFLIMMVVTFIAVMAGAHHQIVMFFISAITYLVLTNQIKKDEKANY